MNWFKMIQAVPAIFCWPTADHSMAAIRSPTTYTGIPMQVPSNFIGLNGQIGWCLEERLTAAQAKCHDFVRKFHAAATKERPSAPSCKTLGLQHPA